MFGLPLPRLGRPSRFSNAIFTGVATFAAGTAGAPSITFGATATTGMYSSGSGQIAFTASATLRMFVGDGNTVWSNTEAFGYQDASIGRGGANSLNFGSTTPSAGAATTRTEINKAVTAFTDAVAKTVFTVTVPNAAHHAVIELEVQGALGAGGAIGAGEAMATNTYKIAIVRTAGVATVATATAAGSAVAVAVAGANTVTATAAVSAISGAVGATQTFTIDVTITKNAGTSDNHTCLAYAKLMNANATGITIA